MKFLNQSYRVGLFLIILIFAFSCQTNKVPRWVSETPPEDDIYIYFVGSGSDGGFESVINQVYERYNIKENEYLYSLLASMLEIAGDQTSFDSTQDLAIIDRWNSDNIGYILVRIKKSFFSSLIDLYTTGFEDMMSYNHDLESDGDDSEKNGELFRAFDNYMKALELMLLEDNEFYSPSIIRIIDKALGVVQNLSYLEKGSCNPTHE